ncbi:hypothetical protein DV735_g5434, partial [Chaetothyriales sp. CBS 134920]
MADRPGQTPVRIVRLMCAQCDTSLGTFENEWIQLTSSYARPKQRGRHTMTEIGNRVRQVPAGVSQKAAEGCGMAEVFCRVCSCLVGQYCRTAPNREQQELVDKYFYKFSKTFLIDADSLESVDPLFTGADAAEMPVHVPARPRISNGSRIRSRTSQSRRSLAQHSHTERHSLVDATASEHESAVTSRRSDSILLEASALQHKEEEDAVVKNQQKQITALSKQIDSLKRTINELSTMVHELYAERHEPGAEASASASASAHMKTPGKNSLARSGELERLRTENEQMRRRFAMIESVMGVKPDTGRGLGRLEDSRHNNRSPSKEQPPTPCASQQSSLEVKRQPRASRHQEDSEAEAGQHSGERYLTPENHGADTEMQLGSEPFDDSSSDPPVRNSSTLTSLPPTEEHAPSMAVKSCSELPHSNHSQPTVAPTQTPASVSSETKAQTRPQTRLSTKQRPLFQSPPHQAFFGVIKPPKKTQKAKQAPSAQLNSTPSSAAALRLHEEELVEFSDDENPVPHKDATVVESQADTQLYYGTSVRGPPRAPGVSPWVARDPAVVNQTTPFVTCESNSSSRPSSSDPGSVNLQIQITGPDQVRDCLEKGESLFSDIKEAREKRTPIQTTQRLLNEELTELGMEEWIGKDKNTKEYRQMIEQARAERRERKKQEVLAKAGVVCAPDSASPQPTPPVVAEVTKRKPGRPSKKSLALQSAASVKSQPKPSMANKSGRNPSKRKAVALEDSDVDATTGQPLDIEHAQSKKAVGRKSRKSESQQQDMDEQVMTRRQTQAAEINKLESRGHEAAEAEEGEVITYVPPMELAN